MQRGYKNNTEFWLRGLDLVSRQKRGIHRWKTTGIMTGSTLPGPAIVITVLTGGLKEIIDMQKKLTASSVILVLAFVGFILWSPSVQSDQKFAAVSPVEASALIEKHKGDPDFVVLDIRTPGEYQSGHIENSIMIDFYSKTYVEEINQLDKEKIYLVHCRSGNRSSRSMALFKKLQFQKIYHLSSGINGWKSEGLPLVK
jgi:rhodanese-related sulfurtransferase